MARTQEYTAEEVVAAIRESNGVVKTAAANLGCDPSTVYRYANRYVTVQEALEESRKNLATEAEGYMVAAMRDRDHKAHYKAIRDVMRMYHDDYVDQQSEQDITSGGEAFSVVINPPQDDGSGD